MRADDSIKHRPLHELLNFDDDDLPDRVNRQKRSESSSNYGMSMSSVGALESFIDEDVSENLQSESELSITERTSGVDAEPSNRRQTFLVLGVVIFIATVITALVNFTEVIPKIKDMKRKSDSNEKKLKMLKALSTGKLSFLITWKPYQGV
jgi:hypothetical protein